jgi:hypothetical protein
MANEVIGQVLETLEDTANILRENFDQAQKSLTPEQWEKYKDLTLSVCFDVLKASSLDNSIQ